MAYLLAIDPGTTESGWVSLRDGVPHRFGKDANDVVLGRIDTAADNGIPIAVEMVASYGMAVGAEVFETCVWIGRFLEAGKAGSGVLPLLVYRRDVKLHLTGQVRAKDANIRQALLDRFGPGREKAIGTKANPGPCYGMKADIWQALALAVTVHDGAVSA